MNVDNVSDNMPVRSSSGAGKARACNHSPAKRQSDTLEMSPLGRFMSENAALLAAEKEPRPSVIDAFRARMKADLDLGDDVIDVILRKLRE